MTVPYIWHKYHSWYFKIVSNFTHLTAREITYNNFITREIYAKYHYKSYYYLYKYIENTFRAMQSTLRCLEMHSKRRYRTCFCSVILGELESSKLKGPQYYFPPNFRYYVRKWNIFSDSSVQRIFQSENFRFPFFYKK